MQVISKEEIVVWSHSLRGRILNFQMNRKDDRKDDIDDDGDSSKPMCKPQDPIWTILPSYYMYHSTFTGDQDPPQYTELSDNFARPGSYSECDSSSRVVSSHLSSELNTEITSVSQSDTSYRNNSRSDLVGLSDGSFIVADESSSSWRETILDNFSHLRNLTGTDNEMSNAVKLSFHFTKDVGERGVKPEIIDPSLYEYKQGDYLNGFIYIKNEGTKPIPFDMFYVHFDGNFIVSDKNNVKSRQPIKIRKFLEMYDFAASWNPVSVNRLLSEKDNTYCCPYLFDPLDKSQLSIGPERMVYPGILYKRFFTFKIPTRLLDTECNDHNLPGHTELPPTLGTCPTEREQWKKSDKMINDFSFVDTSISHGLWARFIGKASKYDATMTDAKGCKLINAKGDEFVILKEAGSFIRILQETNIPSDAEKMANNRVTRVTYDNFVEQIKERIAVGKELCKAIKTLDCRNDALLCHRIAAEEAVQREARNDHVKSQQLFTRDSHARDVKATYHVPKSYDIAIPYRKKSLFSRSKELGSIMLSTPKIDYLLSYISPKRFRTRGPIDPSSWKVEIPFEITYSPCRNRDDVEVKPPEILSVYGELVVFTLKSNNRPIPIELNHAFLFKNTSKMDDCGQSIDDFTHIVKHPMQQYAGELYNLFKVLGTTNFQVQKGMVEDLAALSKVEEKYNRLVLEDMCVKDESTAANPKPCVNGIKIPWSRLDGDLYKKKFSLCVDVTKAKKMLVDAPPKGKDYKSYDEFTLVPSFQTCLMSRLYYFRFVLRFSGNQCIECKLPVNIAKAATRSD